MKYGLVIGRKRSRMVGGAKEDYGKVIWLNHSPVILDFAKESFGGRWELLVIETKYLDQKFLHRSGNGSDFYYYTKNIPVDAIRRVAMKKRVEGEHKGKPIFVQDMVIQEPKMRVRVVTKQKPRVGRLA
jgi:hypothetical protein